MKFCRIVLECFEWKLNSNAASGYDSVSGKLIKYLITVIPDILIKAIRKEMDGQRGKTLNKRLRKIILIEKKDTKHKTIKKLRPITLLSNFYKIISIQPSLLFSYFL